jgi:hypothetical protein
LVSSASFRFRYSIVFPPITSPSRITAVTRISFRCLLISILSLVDIHPCFVARGFLLSWEERARYSFQRARLCY